jgi:hypothetical protein
MRFGHPTFEEQALPCSVSIFFPKSERLNIDDTGLAIRQLLNIGMFSNLVSFIVSSTIFNSVFSASISSSIELLTGPFRAPLTTASNALAFLADLRLLDISPEILDLVLRV